jgi:hypothetical protein
MCIGSRVAALLIAALNNSMHSPCKTDLSIILPDSFNPINIKWEIVVKLLRVRWDAIH